MMDGPSTSPSTPSDVEHLRRALEAARLGDWSWDAATDLVTLSHRAAEIFGVAAGPTLTWSGMREMLHPDDRDRVYAAIQTALSARSHYDLEFRITTDAGEKWVSSGGHGRYSGDGAVVGMVGIAQDITSQVRTRQQMREQADALQTLNDLGRILSAELNLKKLAQALIDAATSVVCAEFGAFYYNVLDTGGGTYTLYAISGLDRRHLERLSMPRSAALSGPGFRDEGIMRIGDVTQDPRYNRHTPLPGMPHGLATRSYLVVPVVSRSGESLGGLFFGHAKAGVFTEGHERIIAGLAGQAAVAIDNARLFDAAQKARETAEIASRLKDEFLATVSHELRTPLNAVLGWTTLLRSTHMDDVRRASALDTIERNARLQQKIVEDLLDVSRIVAGQLRLEKEPMPFRPIVESAVESVRPSAAAKSIRLTVGLGDDPAVLIGDPARLQQVVTNLLSNAIKFTPDRGAIRVSLDVTESRVELAVADTGVGIAPAFLPHVFERFRQEDQRVTRSHGGLGLGLAIVRYLTEMHGGSVAAVSAGEGKGATFIVRLPTA